MAIKYEPYGVYVVIETEDRVIVENREGDYSFPFSYGRNKETPQKCARRIIERMSLKAPGFIKSMPYIGRKDISSIPFDVREKWPSGAKTIPIYWFTAKLEYCPDELLEEFTFLKKEEASEMIEAFKDAYPSSKQINKKKKRKYIFFTFKLINRKIKCLCLKWHREETTK